MSIDYRNQFDIEKNVWIEVIAKTADEKKVAIACRNSDEVLLVKIFSFFKSVLNHLPFSLICDIHKIYRNESAFCITFGIFVLPNAYLLRLNNNDENYLVVNATFSSAIVLRRSCISSRLTPALWIVSVIFCKAALASICFCASSCSCWPASACS